MLVYTCSVELSLHGPITEQQWCSGQGMSPNYFVGGTPFPHLLSGHGGTLLYQHSPK